MNRVETPAQEFSRLVIEYNEGKKDSPTRQEAWNLIADFALEHCDIIIRALSTPIAAGGGEAIEPPISQLMRDDGEPEWKQINALFLRNDINAFPIRLRDELSTMLAWARYGERAALSTAGAVEPVRARDNASLIEEYRNLVKTGAEYAASELRLAPTSAFEIYMGHFRDIGRDIESALASPPLPDNEEKRS